MAVKLNSQGWCPECLLHSVVRTREKFICTSPECRWETRKETADEDEIFGSPPMLDARGLDRLRRIVGIVAESTGIAAS